MNSFLSAPRSAWQGRLKKTEEELELLTNINMLLTVEKGNRGGMCHAIHRYAKANNKYMKNYNKNISLYPIIPHVFRRKKFVWMGNVSKAS